MQAVLTDLHLAEVYAGVLKGSKAANSGTKNVDSLASYYAAIFKHHSITTQEFSYSLDWYKEHPEDLDSIYQKMIPEFSKLEAAFSKQ